MSIVLDLKKYLSENNFGHLYTGNINSEIIDNNFITSVKSLENTIAQSIGTNTIDGLIISGNKINNNITINDIKKSIKLIKSAQAVYDNLVPYEEMIQPTAIQLVNNPGRILEEADPNTNQRQGIANDVRLPTSLDPLDLDPEKLKNMDERVQWMMSLKEK